MQEYVKKPSRTSLTLDKYAKGPQQAPIPEILQTYKKESRQKHSIQFEKANENIPLQSVNVNNSKSWKKGGIGASGKIIQMSIWDSILTLATPDQCANSLENSLDEFKELKTAANKNVLETYGKVLKYSWKPKEGGGTTSAYYKDGEIFLDNSIPMMTLANTIFETANAAQASKFRDLEKDFDDDSINDKILSDYEIDDLGKTLEEEYRSGDKVTKRAIIQERYEWGSFLLARPTFMAIKTQSERLRDTLKEEYESVFGTFNEMIEIKTFEEYYKRFGRGHRGSVENVLRSVESKKRKCYITTACIEHKGLTDNCEELTLLRKFRDDYLYNKPNGEELIKLYYQYAPQIVNEIDKRSDKKEIYKNLYQVIRICVTAIKNEDSEFAFKTYCSMVKKLYDEFINKNMRVV